MTGAQRQIPHGVQNRGGFKLGQFVVLHLTHVTVGLHDVQNGLIHQGVPVYVAFDIALPGHGAYLGYHGFGQGLPLLPIGKIVVWALAFALVGHGMLLVSGKMRLADGLLSL